MTLEKGGWAAIQAPHPHLLGASATQGSPFPGTSFNPPPRTGSEVFGNERFSRGKKFAPESTLTEHIRQLSLFGLPAKAIRAKEAFLGSRTVLVPETIPSGR